MAVSLSLQESTFGPLFILVYPKRLGYYLCMDKSLNQLAQEDGDTGRNEVARQRASESAVKVAWRTRAFHFGESSVTVLALVAATNLPADYILRICERHGYAVKS